jgi:hypothetical protein
MYCHEDEATAAEVARGPIIRFLESLVDASSDWTSGMTSNDYQGYERLFARDVMPRFAR